MNAFWSRKCLAKSAGTLVVAGVIAFGPWASAQGAEGQEPASADLPMAVDLIDGSVTLVDVATLQQIFQSVCSLPDEALAAALRDVLRTSPLPTAAILVATCRLCPGRVRPISAGAALSERADREEALQLFSYDACCDVGELVAGVQSVDPSLAAALSDYVAAELPQNPRPPEQQTSFVRETAENPRQISPQVPEDVQER